MSPTPDTWAALRRPLQASSAREGTCVPAEGRDAATIPGALGFVPGVVGGYVAFGGGPVYPAFATRAGAAVLSYAELPKHDGTGFVKVVWIVEPTRSGPALVRGVRADGATRLRFMSGDELKLMGSGTHPEGYVYIPSAGCYTIQIDGESFTSMVTLHVLP